MVAWKTFSVRWPRLSPKKRMSWRSRWIIHDVCAKKKNLCGPFIISYCAVHCEQLRFVIFSFKLYISKIIINTGSARVLFFSLYDPQINGYDFTWTPHVVRTYLTNHFDSLGGEEELSFFSAMSPPPRHARYFLRIFPSVTHVNSRAHWAPSSRRPLTTSARHRYRCVF